MPQGRRKDFSGKQKKMQLQQKRIRKTNQDEEKIPSKLGNFTARFVWSLNFSRISFRFISDTDSSLSVVSGQPGASGDVVQDLLTSVTLPSRSVHSGRQKYELRFRKETKEELAQKREKARKPIQVMTYKYCNFN